MIVPTRIAAALLSASLLLAGPALAAPQDGGGGEKPPETEKKPPEGEKKPPEGEKKAPEPPPPPTPDEVKEFTKQYEEGLKKSSDEDAIAGVQKVRAWYANPGTDADSKKALLALMARVAEQKSRESLLEAACKALADFGDSGVNILKYVVDRGISQKVPPVGAVRAGLASLGKIASPKPGDVKFLIDIMKKDGEFVVDSMNALAGYAKAPGVVRKEIFEALLNRSAGVFSKSENNDQTEKRKWNTWGSEAVDAMVKVSHKQLKNPKEYADWRNDKGKGGGKNPETWADPPPADKETGK